MSSALNENIKQLRLARGMNQVEFAKKLGVTKQCVSNWENDNVLPSVEMLMKIASCSPSALTLCWGESRPLFLTFQALPKCSEGISPFLSMI